MKSSRLGITAGVLFCFSVPLELSAQQAKPKPEGDFDCYVESAEARMQSRTHFLLADSDSSLKVHVLRDRKVQTSAANGANPHQAADGLIHDWAGTVFIPGVSLDRVIHLLQDYDHRAQYFSDVLSASKLLCRTGQDRFRASMRLREPTAIDTENDIVWQHIDQHHWQSRSYSINIKEVGSDHKYLLRLNSYWRFSEADQGVYVEGETITLSGQFGSATRALGSLFGISPEKSLKHTLELIRENALKPGLELASPPVGLPTCGEIRALSGCAFSPSH